MPSLTPIPALFARAATAVVATLLAVGLSGCAPDGNSRAHSIAAIIANPKAFEGRVVTVRGYVHLGADGDAVYLHEDDYRWGISANGIWLHLPHCANRAGAAVSAGYMTVVGNFTATLHGHADEWLGEIDNIKLCRVIEGVDGDPRPRR